MFVYIHNLFHDLYLKRYRQTYIMLHAARKFVRKIKYRIITFTWD